MASDNEKMASILVDGRRVELSPEGMKSIKGRSDEVGMKVREAVERSIAQSQSG